MTLARSILNETPLDRRGWEYNYLNRLFNHSFTTLHGHSNRVTCVAFSPDGTRIVSGSFDRTLRVWDSTTVLETLTLRVRTGNVTTVAFSPDSKHIIGRNADNTITIWDADGD